MSTAVAMTAASITGFASSVPSGHGGSLAVALLSTSTSISVVLLTVASEAASSPSSSKFVIPVLSLAVMSMLRASLFSSVEVGLPCSVVLAL